MDRVRILSFEAYELYDATTEQKSFLVKEDESYRFRIFLEWSLDSEQLKSTYEKVLLPKLFSKDVGGNQCTDAVINVSFTRKDPIKGKKAKELRKILYSNGFYVNGVRYVRYKRSSGSSREGKCLFIREELLKDMEEWGDCGINFYKNNMLAAWESYKALTLSTIIGKINIPIDSILFVEDYTSKFKDEVMSIVEDDTGLSAEEEETEISNNIWDGESLLDESLFTDSIYEDKHMLLLRNKFFKSCAFRTRLQDWIKDNNIASVEQLKSNGCVTLAKDIKKILMVTTPSSLKYLKFVEGGLTEDNIKKWADSVKSEFGVVKYDKRTRYFGGRLVRSSYQLLNTIHLNEEETKEFIKPTVSYIKAIKNDPAVLRYHVFEASKPEKINNSSKETEVEEDFEEYGLMRRGQIIFCLYELNPNFAQTRLCANLVNRILRDQKEKAKVGNILVPGTNATIFGNGPELLKRIIGGQFGGQDQLTLGKGKIRCERFKNGEKLLCARSPHITMGNLYIAENIVDKQDKDSIWSYFNLGENIVCVNAIGENIQQRLNGCDYDSDTMLITNDTSLVGKASEEGYYDVFKVPVCKITEEETNKTALELSDLDSANSHNKVGEIVNLSQILNSLLWDRVNNGKKIKDEMELYKDICKLAVLSGIEVDKAKHSYNVNSDKLLKNVREKYKDDINIKPVFLEESLKKRNKGKNKEKTKVISEKINYKTTVEYIYHLLPKMSDMRKGKRKEIEWKIIYGLIRNPTINCTIVANDAANRIIELCKDYVEENNKLHKELGDIFNNCVYAELRMQTDELYSEVADIINKDDGYYSEDIMKAVLKMLKDQKIEDWRYYAPLFQKSNDSSIKCLFKDAGSTPPIPIIEADENGKYNNFYGINFKCNQSSNANGSDSPCEDCQRYSCEKKSENKQS